jgi:hypothetical protein
MDVLYVLEDLLVVKLSTVTSSILIVVTVEPRATGSEPEANLNCRSPTVTRNPSRGPTPSESRARQRP